MDNNISENLVTVSYINIREVKGYENNSVQSNSYGFKQDYSNISFLLVKEEFVSGFLETRCEALNFLSSLNKWDKRLGKPESYETLSFFVLIQWKPCFIWPTVDSLIDSHKTGLIQASACDLLPRGLHTTLKQEKKHRNEQKNTSGFILSLQLFKFYS